MHSRSLAILGAFALAAGLASAAQAAPALSIVADPAIGPVLADSSGRVLYTWDRDTEPNVSSCTGNCLVNWPLFTATATDVAEGDWTIVTRADGGMVWAYKGDPLYYYINDTAPGMTAGNQPAGTWHAVPAVQVVNDAALGPIYADMNGMTLYTWDRDVEPNTSTCTGNCLVNWPLFTAAPGSIAGGDWTIVTRADGAQVWAYKGKALYYYINDTAPGQTNGNQPAGTWHVVPAGM